MLKLFKRKQQRDPAKPILTAAKLQDIAAEDSELLLTPREAATILDYLRQIGVQIYKKRDSLCRTELAQGNDKVSLCETSIAEIVYNCIEFCDSLIESERAEDYPATDYLIMLVEDKQALAAVWEKLTSQIRYDLNY